MMKRLDLESKALLSIVFGGFCFVLFYCLRKEGTNQRNRRNAVWRK